MSSNEDINYATHTLKFQSPPPIHLKDQTTPITLPKIAVSETSTGQTISKSTIPELERKENASSYRDVCFVEPVEIPAHFVKAFDNRVSFDTVNLKIHPIDTELEEVSSSPSYREGRDYFSLAKSNDISKDYFSLDRSPSPRGRGRSASPNRKRSSSPFVRTGSPSPSYQYNYNHHGPIKFHPPYPTTKIIKHDACTFTKTHEKYDSLYEDKVIGLKPLLPQRLVLVYISGRKHTWVALDWALRELLLNGDQLVVICSIPVMEPNIVQHPEFNTPEPFSTFKNVIKSTNRKLKDKAKPERIQRIVKRMMNYITTIMPPDLIIKITIEVAAGRTKQILKDTYELYDPSIVVVSTKPPSTKSGKSAPLRSWTSGRLSDRLVKNFPLPVVVVPAVNMNQFEFDLFETLNKAYESELARKKNFPKPESSSVVKQEGDINAKDTKRNIPENSDIIGGSTDIKNDIANQNELVRPKLSDEETLLKEKCEMTKNDDDCSEKQSIDGPISVPPSQSEESSSSGLESLSLKSSKVLSSEVSIASDDDEDDDNDVDEGDDEEEEEHDDDEEDDDEEEEHDDEEDDDASIVSESGSIDSSESVSSFSEVKKIYKDEKLKLAIKLAAIEINDSVENKYKDMVLNISDSSLLTCERLLQIDTSLGGKGAKLAREITGSTKIGVPMMKTKSMLNVGDAMEEKINSNPQLIQNTKKNAGYNTKNHQLGSYASNKSKTESSLKFLEPNMPNSSRKLIRPTENLRKSLSHDIPTNKPLLEPSKSQPDMHSIIADKSPKKKKKSKFRLILSRMRSSDEKVRSRSNSRGRSMGSDHRTSSDGYSSSKSAKKWF